MAPPRDPNASPPPAVSARLRALATRDVDAQVLRALARAAQGNLVGALAAWRAAVEGGAAPALVALAGPIFTRIEGRGPRAEAPPPAPPPEPASPAWARAWAGDLEGARRLVEGEGEGRSALGLRGVLDVLEGRPAEGIARLDRAIAAGGGEELVLHRIRALVRLGRIEEARVALLALVDRESLARRTLIALVHARGTDGTAGFRASYERVSATESYLNGLFSNDLPDLVGRPALDRALESPETLAALLDGVLDRLAGNFGLAPTVAEQGPDGERRFVRLVLSPVTRTLAVEALNALRHVGVAGVEAAFAAIRARHPRSVHVHTYRGELLLWLGRYREAAREFFAARRIEPTRWADIGVLAALTLTGHNRRAYQMALLAEQSFAYIPGGTLPVYRGVLRRRSGDLAGAIEDLSTALDAKPTRVGVRIELCLALRATGRGSEAIPHAADLAREAPALLVDAAEARGLDWRTEPALLFADEVFEEALRAMRGNRSSSIVTWIDRRGELRILEPRAALEQEARRALSGSA